jgi:hypothetical protein
MARMKSLAPLLPLALLATACGSAPPEEPAPDVSGWTGETIALPPGFAPDLPTGTEVLRFHPDMFTADTEGYWTYAFAMRVDETGLDAARIDELLELYYDGIVAAVGKDNGLELGVDPAAVEVTEVSPHEFNARIETTDPFVTHAPLTLFMKLLVEPPVDGSTVLRVMASPRAEDPLTWRLLRAAVDSIEL